MKIEINNGQKLKRVKIRKTKTFIKYLINKVSNIDNIKKWKNISLFLTDNDRITLINQRFLNKNEITDVISWYYNPMPCDNGMFSAEVIVNVQLAIQESERRKFSVSKKNKHSAMMTKTWTLNDELTLYIAHGFNHLSGATDYDASGRKLMRHREMLWLEEAKSLGLTDGLI